MANTDLLGSLLSDPAALQNAISMASSLLGNAGTAPEPAVSVPSDTASAPFASTAPEDIVSAPPMAHTFAPSLPSTTADTYDPTADMVSRVMPTIQRVMNRSQSAIDPQKRQLLGAIKPFMGETAALQIDHGMRLVVLARVAYAVMHPEEEG